MNTDGHGFDGPHAELTRSIIGAAMEVANTLGHGLLEKVYENALVVELRVRGLGVEQQRRFEVHYKGVSIGEFVPDLIVGGAVIVDTKTIDQSGTHERGRMINYLRVARWPVGLTVYFKHPKITWDRVLL
jgi:GxxExxY protein